MEEPGLICRELLNNFQVNAEQPQVNETMIRNIFAEEFDRRFIHQPRDDPHDDPVEPPPKVAVAYQLFEWGSDTSSYKDWKDIPKRLRIHQYGY